MTLESIIEQKTISVCVIGKPNAGKSSLLNHVIGQKISIVTPKVQTTRSQITGIITIKDTQIIMLDTPGIFEPKKQLERAMVRCAWSSLHGVDNPKIFKISALSGAGIDELLKYLCSIATNSPWQYEKDDITTSPMRFLAAEITRERLFLNLHEELPYNMTVQTETWEEKNGALYIHQAIIVARENHKMMILGKNGAKIKEISSMARLEMEKSFETKVHLFLFVKVRELWENMPEFYHSMGLKFEKLKSKAK